MIFKPNKFVQLVLAPSYSYLSIIFPSNRMHQSTGILDYLQLTNSRELKRMSLRSNRFWVIYYFFRKKSAINSYFNSLFPSRFPSISCCIFSRENRISNCYFQS